LHNTLLISSSPPFTSCISTILHFYLILAELAIL
jgi:hypothetical protein